MDEGADEPRPAGDADDALAVELRDVLRGGDPPGAELDALFQRVEREVAAERGPSAWLRARPTAVRAALAWIAAGSVAAVALLAFGRPDMTVYPAARMTAVLLVITAGLAACLSLALRPLHRPAVPVRTVAAAVAGALLGLLALYLLPAAHAAHPASQQASGWAALLQRALPCLAIGLGVGGLVLALLWTLDRGGSRRALVMAVAAGLAANLALQLHCPVTAPMHLLLGHLGVALLLVAGALLPLGRRGR